MNAPAHVESTGMHAGLPWRRWLWILAFGAVVFGGRVYESDLRVDSLRYAGIARGMADGGSWLVPHLGEEVFLNKPPLLFWLTAPWIRLLGPTVFAAKITSILGGLVLLLLVERWAWRLFRNEALCWIAPVVAAITHTIHRETNGCRMESLLAVAILGGLLAVAKLRESGQLRWGVLWGAAGAVGVLAKGLPGLLPLVAGLLWLPFAGSAISRSRLLTTAILAVAVTVAGAGWWFMAVSQRTDFGKNYLQGQVFDRMAAGRDLGDAVEDAAIHTTTTEVYRTDPWHAYARALLKDHWMFLPLLVWGLIRMVRGPDRPEPGAGGDLLVAAGLAWLLAIHLLATKYGRYLYWLYAALSIPTALPLAALARSQPVGVWFRGLVAAAAVAVCVYPGPLRGNVYRRLAEVNEIRSTSGLPVVVGSAYLARLDGRASSLYFLGHFETKPPPGDYILIERRRLDGKPVPEPPHGHALISTPKFTAWLVVTGTADKPL